MTTPSTPPPPPPPGWYPDPDGRPGLRYWDGTNWTISAPPTPAAPIPGYAVAGAPVPAPGASQPAKPGGSINKRWALGVAGVFAVLVAIAAFSDSGGDSKKSESSSPSTRSAAASPPRASAPSATKTREIAPPDSAVRDGKFEFQVLGVERGATSMDDAFAPEIAKGEFFTVKIRVTNVGDDARSFSATNQKLIIDGNEYDATSFMNNGWMEKINPGLGIDTQATFDIPKGAVPTAIEFHDSMFSGGAQVALAPAS